MSDKCTLTISSEYELSGGWFKNTYKMTIPFDSVKEAQEYMHKLMLTRQKRAVAEYGAKIKDVVEEPFYGLVHETEGSKSAFDTKWIYTIHQET